MATPTSILQLRWLGKKKMAAVVQRAKRLGLTPQAYLKRLVEEDLEISDRARRSTFEELLEPGERVDEAELDRLVEVARDDYHNSKGRTGRTR